MFNWTVLNLDRKTADGFVHSAHWTVTATDGDFSASAYGSVYTVGAEIAAIQNGGQAAEDHQALRTQAKALADGWLER